MTVLLQLNGITSYGQQKCLFEKITFTIASGEFVSLIGPNGAGKTSILKAIIGLLPLTSGTIVRSETCHIGYVPQKTALNPLMPLSVDAFLSLSHNQNHKQGVIVETGIQNLLSSSMHTLSGGEHQRVMLARALMNKPTVLILDEPTQGLDPAGERQFLTLIEHLHKHHHIAILMVSHDLHFVHKASQKVICLNQHICCSGTPETITSHHDYQALFPSHQHDAILTPYVHDHSHTHDNLETPQCSHTPEKEES